MIRREFITLLGGAAAWPLRARAQQSERMRRIGVLNLQAADDAMAQARHGAFLQGLQQAGWTIGRNVWIDTRWATNAADIRRHAAELAALAPDVILATGATVGAMLQATRTVPIVFTIVADPVAAGFVDSLAQPGGNATGFMIFEYSLSAKWLELLKEIAPGVTRAVVLRDTIGIRRQSVCRHPSRRAVATDGGHPHQHARLRRDRALPRGLRAFPEWRLDRGGECAGDCSS